GSPAPTSATGTAAGAPPAAPENGVSIREPAADLQQATEARATAEQELAQAREEMEAALAPGRQALEAARERVQEAQAGRTAALIRAPIRGTVLALNAQPDQEIGADPKTPVATIVNLTALAVQAPMKADLASAVRPGMPATLTFDEVPNQS